MAPPPLVPSATDAHQVFDEMFGPRAAAPFHDRRTQQTSTPKAPSSAQPPWIWLCKMALTMATARCSFRTVAAQLPDSTPSASSFPHGSSLTSSFPMASPLLQLPRCSTEARGNAQQGSSSPSCRCSALCCRGYRHNSSHLALLSLQPAQPASWLHAWCSMYWPKGEISTSWFNPLAVRLHARADPRVICMLIATTGNAGICFERNHKP